MFNSVAKYLWGGVENEEDYTDRPEHDQRIQEVPVPDDGDWVLVDSVDKENCCQTAHIHHPNLHHYPSHHPASYHQPMFQLQSPHDPAGPSNQGASDELLDDAASLAHHLAVQSNKFSRVSATESRLLYTELDSVESSDFEENGLDSGLRPSSPESVFSACSGRSHATYRPKGHFSEAWVVAPPPCFTGSRLCDSGPLASSPMENLLIEHPSMSVYHSVASSTLPSSHPTFFVPAITDPSPEAGRALEEGSAVVGQESNNGVRSSNDEVQSLAIQPMRHHNQAALHAIQLSPEKLLEKSRIAQRHKISHNEKAITQNKCHRQNLVQAYSSSSSKRSNRRNKLMRPSGCMSSRTSQRVH